MVGDGPQRAGLAGEDPPMIGTPEPISGLSPLERRLLAFLDSPVIA